MGAVDWDRRMFDALIPLPDGTSYNAYLVQGRDLTVLIDTTEPTLADELRDQLADVPKLDYIIANHAEQDHSGVLPWVMEKYPAARVLCTGKARSMLVEHLHVDESRLQTVNDGDTLALGGRTLEFMHTPWVHWPETMCTYLREDRILFSCDFFGSHLATCDLYVTDEARVCEAAKRYYAEIMMPFRGFIQKHLERLRPYAIDLIAPSHGPIYGNPKHIMDAYRDWVAGPPLNMVVIPYVTMHGSTGRMVAHLGAQLADRGISVQQFNLSTIDIGKLAIALVDAATLVLGTSTVHVGPHPLAFYAAHLANCLRPKLKNAAVIGSYGWATKAAEQVANLLPNLKLDVLDPVICRGLPTEADYQALNRLADGIEAKHRAMGIA